MFLFLPYRLVVIVVPVLAAIPFYYLYKYAQTKLQPRKSGKHLLLYFGVVLAGTVGYIALVFWVIVWGIKVIFVK